MKNKIKLINLVIILFISFSGLAQEKTTVLTKKEKKQAIEKVCQLLNKFYVFPEVAIQMEKHIKAKQKDGAFKNINDKKAFVNFMTKELRSICHDKHLGMYIGPNPENNVNEDLKLKRILHQLDIKKNNYGMTEVSILEANVGYLKINSVMYSEEAINILESALKFLSNTDAIIFDLRINNGGDPMFMAHLFSYFFDKPTHINSVYWRDRDRTDEFWTHEDVSGEKMLEIPLYVLISKETFSGAEEFAYDLQALNRATVIGEVSAGGANPANTWLVFDDLRISIPYGRAINPVTNSNWEGVGVLPDIETSAEKALEVALGKAKISAENYFQTKKNRLIKYYEEYNHNLEEAAKLIEKNKIEEAEAIVISSVGEAIQNKLINQSAINQLGYDFLGQENTKMAILIFKSNVVAYPESVDVYDSLGEAYLEDGNKELAIFNYKKALEIDPNYPTALRALEEIARLKN